jgi:hypothetical protein
MPARRVHTTDDAQPRDRYWSIVSDLVSLIDATRGYQWVNDEPEPAPSDEDNVVVLDDVAPTQSPEILLLSDCNLRLREALHFLLEARAAHKQAQRGVGRGEPAPNGFHFGGVSFEGARPNAA